MYEVVYRLPAMEQPKRPPVSRLAQFHAFNDVDAIAWARRIAFGAMWLRLSLGGRVIIDE